MVLLLLLPVLLLLMAATAAAAAAGDGCTEGCERVARSRWSGRVKRGESWADFVGSGINQKMETEGLLISVVRPALRCVERIR